MSQTARQTVTICNERGLHARASAAFSRLAQTFSAMITVFRSGMSADGVSIIELLSLGAGIGCDIEIEANGEDAEDALAALVALVEDRFGEAR